MSHRDWDLQCKVYIGNLGNNASKHEIESMFNKYGPLKNIWIARNPPGFAFVEYEDPRDAEDAVRGMDGTRLCGNRIRVEMSSGRSRQQSRGARSGGGGRDRRYNGNENYGRSYKSRSRSPRRRLRSKSNSPRYNRMNSRDK